MKKIVIIGANEFQNPLIITAKKMGYETHVFAWKDGSIGEKTADFFYPISIVEKEQILKKCLRIKPEAVTSIASDLGNITAQFLSEKLGLLCNSKYCIEATTDKFRMRSLLKKFGIQNQHFIEVSQNESFKISNMFNFPLIIKPVDRSGSRGVTKIMNKKDLAKAIKIAIANSFKKKAIIEEFIDGEEFSCECISFLGSHHLLAITKKYTTGPPNFIEIGHIEPTLLTNNVKKKIQSVIFSALDILDIKNGASHSEFIITKEGDIKIIEIGSRMGGDCIGSDLVKISTGKDFVRMVIEVATGRKPDFSRKTSPKAAAIRFILYQDDIRSLKELLQKNSEAIYRVSEIKPINNQKITSSSMRYGFYILSCDSIEKVKKLSRLL